MKMIMMALLASTVGMNAFAEVSPEQAANAVLQCTKDVRGLSLSGNEFVRSVSMTTKEKKKSRTTVNTYTIHVGEGRGFMGIMQIGILTAIQTIVQPDPRAADKPADVSWSCSTITAK